MFRKFAKVGLFGLLCALLVSCAVSGFAFTLLGPVNGQKVRENVRISIPESKTSNVDFISLFLIVGEKEQFIGAMPSRTAINKNGALIFFWNSKAPFADQSDLKTGKYLADGPYKLIVHLHNNAGNTIDSAEVNINLRNKITRSIPNPPVKLVNRLDFGQSNTFQVSGSADVYDQMDLPILGELGIVGTAKVTQSVEDVRPDGIRMIRYRISDPVRVTVGSQRTILYPYTKNRPQVYRLIDPFGKVVATNVFKKQKGTSIIDILPILPRRKVREGDMWNDSMSVKIEGLTSPINLKGTAVLDSFEWQNNEPCAKIVSNLTGTSSINLGSGLLQSTGGKVTAKVVTYFAYKKNKLIARDIMIEFPAIIGSSNMSSGMGAVPNNNSSSDSIEEDDESGSSSQIPVLPASGRMGGNAGGMPGMMGGMPGMGGGMPGMMGGRGGMGGMAGMAAGRSTGPQKGTVKLIINVNLGK